MSLIRSGTLIISQFTRISKISYVEALVSRSTTVMSLQQVLPPVLTETVNLSCFDRNRQFELFMASQGVLQSCCLDYNQRIPFYLAFE